MNTPISGKRTLAVTILAILPLVTACGGDSEEEEAPPVFDEPDFQQTCYSWIAYYDDPAACQGGGTGVGSSTPPPDAGSTPPGPGSTATSGSASGISALIHDEAEPNDTLANANVMGYPTRTGNASRVGWSVNASIDATGDAADHFVFSATVAHNYLVRLCPPSGTLCHGTDGLDSLTAYFDLLDASGNVLLSSRDSGTNVRQWSIDAGVAYFVRVVAADTMGVPVAYSFQAFEW